MKIPKIIPADVYDTIEFVAEAYGGIGGGWFTEEEYLFVGDNDATPLCLRGCTDFIDGGAPSYVGSLTCELQAVVGRSFVTFNDQAVRAINKRRGAAAYSRVPFSDYVAELGWVRGPHPTEVTP